VIESGDVTVDGVTADLADPGATEPAYDRTPLHALRSLLQFVAGDLQEDLPRIACPLLLMTSVEDHVVDPANSDHLASVVAGPVERVALIRSYHVATLDFDRGLVADLAVAFAGRVAS
jgi:carboxylesterase